MRLVISFVCVSAGRFGVILYCPPKKKQLGFPSPSQPLDPKPSSGGRRALPRGERAACLLRLLEALRTGRALGRLHLEVACVSDRVGGVLSRSLREATPPLEWPGPAARRGGGPAAGSA